MDKEAAEFWAPKTPPEGWMDDLSEGARRSLWTGQRFLALYGTPPPQHGGKTMWFTSEIDHERLRVKMAEALDYRDALVSGRDLHAEVAANLFEKGHRPLTLTGELALLGVHTESSDV